MNRRRFLIGSAGLMLAGCTPCCKPRQRMVSVGSKNFTEQLVLGELVAQNTRSATFHTRSNGAFISPVPTSASRRFFSGRIDVYVEYTGTALAAILKQTAHSGFEGRI